MTCHLVVAVNETETEVNLFLKNDVAKRGRMTAEESSSLPKVSKNCTNVVLGCPTGSDPKMQPNLTFSLKNRVLLQQVVTHRGCLYNEARFSTGLGYFVVDCKGPDVPRVLLYNGVTLQEGRRAPLLDVARQT